MDITTDKMGAEAKQEAFDQATEQATQKLTEELLGAEKAAKYWPGIKTKILKNSTRYVLFIKGSPPQAGQGGTHVTVMMRLSTDNLETLLRDEGLLNSGGVRLLPLIEIVDGRGQHYMWWTDASGDPGKSSTPKQDMFKKFHDQLASKFKSKNVYVLDPTSASFRMNVPAAYRLETLRRDDQTLFAQYLKADIVLSGKVAVERAGDGLKLNYDLQLWQAKSGRGVGEVQRMENLTSDNPKVVQALLEQTDKKVMDELATRLGDALASGNLNLNLVKVSIRGTLSYSQQSEFKKLLGQVREIRVLKERLFEPGGVTFEAETQANGQDLAKAVERTKFPQYAVQVDSAQDDSLALSVKALSSSSAQ